MVNDLICQLVTERSLSAVVVTHNFRLASLMNSSLELSDGKLRPNNGLK
jgi:ABC-type lipoprotein export system ATPase subunit